MADYVAAVNTLGNEATRNLVVIVAVIVIFVAIVILYLKRKGSNSQGPY